MSEKRLDSGLYVVETPPPEPPKPPEPAGPKCANCDRRSVDGRGLFLRHKMSDGFKAHNPCCKHAPYVRCPDCEGKFHGCPECGHQWEYT